MKDLFRGPLLALDPTFYRDSEENRQEAERRLRTLELGDPVNVALAINGATAAATTTFSAAYPAIAALRGDRQGKYHGVYGTFQALQAAPSLAVAPVTFTVTFVTPTEISRIDLVTLQDAYMTPIVPDASTTFTLYGLTAFDVKWFDPAGTRTLIEAVTGNTLVIHRNDFAPVLAAGVEIVCKGTPDNYARIAFVGAYSALYTFQRT